MKYESGEYVRSDITISGPSASFARTVMTSTDFGRVAYLSDIHANAHAFSAALKAISSLEVDSLVILGDLLTYGCEPNWTLDLLHGAFKQWNTTLISGNHDQLYFSLPRRDSTYINHLPGWIRESALWTKVQLRQNYSNTKDLLWLEELQSGDSYVAHANPKGFGNWEYLEGDDALSDAAKIIREKGATIGVFGHTHRPGIISFIDDTITHHSDRSVVYNADDYELLRTVIVNTGSIGQPRTGSRKPTFLIINHGKERAIEISLHEFDYDMEGHLESINRSDMTSETKSILMRFYK